MEAVIETLATGIGNLATFVVTSGVALVVFGVLWASFAAAVIWNPAGLHDAWQWLGSLPLVVQLLVWLLFLPVMVGIWIWETAWPLVVRLVLVTGLAGSTLWMFLPRALLPGR
jgi:hypothetical protein